MYAVARFLLKNNFWAIILAVAVFSCFAPSALSGLYFRGRKLDDVKDEFLKQVGSIHIHHNHQDFGTGDPTTQGVGQFTASPRPPILLRNSTPR
jgi:hypothetical protein